MVLAVISTDIKKSSFLWNKNAKDMFNKLQLHHAILRVNFNYYGFDICPSSPEGDAFIASQHFDTEKEAMEKVKACIRIITSTFVWCRKNNKLSIGKQNEKDEYKNKIHIRIGVAVGEPNSSAPLSHVPSGVDENGDPCSLNNKAIVCSNSMVYKSEQAEINCENWVNHYCVWRENGFEQCESDILKDARGHWIRADKQKVIPKKLQKTGMVLFLHADECKEDNNYCGKLSDVICMAQTLLNRGWVSIKVKRDKTAMLVRTNISIEEAVKEFDWLTQNTNLVLAAGYGTFNLVLNKTSMPSCYAPDAFGDIVNGSARMHDGMCILDEQFKPLGDLEQTTRQKLNLGKGDVWIYRSTASKSEKACPLKF